MIDRPTRPAARNTLLSAEQIAGLETLHKDLARGFAAALLHHAAITVEPAAVRVEQIAYATFLTKLETPTFLAIVEAPPLEGSVLVHLGPSILLPILDALLGGRSSTAMAPRPLTDIDTRLARKVVELLLAELRQAWSAALPIEPRIVRTETRRETAGGASSFEAMARIKFDLSLGSLHGAVQLCLPCRSLAGLATLPLSLEPGFANDVAGISSPQQPIDVVVTLAEMRVTAEQLAALQPGDILATDRSCRGTLSVEADGVRLLRGRPGTSAGRKAVRIEQRVPRR